MYDRLRKIVDTTKIIDDHGHPGFAEYFEDLPEHQRIPFASDPYKTPEECATGFSYLRDLHYEAYEKFYGFTKADIQESSKKQNLAAEYDRKRKTLDTFINEILDESGVELLMANICIPKRLEGNPRIRLVPALDPLIFPFDNTLLKERLISKFFIGYFEYMLGEIKAQYHYVETGFEGYLALVDQVMAGHMKADVPAFKFVLAYDRNTYFRKIDPAEGPALYAAAQAGDQDAYSKLQDLLVWYIMRKIVKVNMAVQFHFAITDNFVNYFDPLNLANMLEDPELKDAKIVILHGAYPRYGNAEILALGGLTVNNVCIDISGRIMFANHPRIIAKMLRDWLEKPALWDKLIYGSDVLWGDRYIYTCARTGRDAIYFALAGMIDEDIIDEDTAISIAKKILRENALRLYNLKGIE